MSEARKRVYRSELREEQARVTRRRVVDAAADLFTERGFAATTIDAVADAAGVSRTTIIDLECGARNAQLMVEPTPDQPAPE